MISKATIELEEYPASLLFSKSYFTTIVLSIIYRKLVGKLYSCYYVAHQTLTGLAPLFFFKKKHEAFTLMTWKKNPQAPLKLNLNPRPSTKPYRKGRERWGKSSPQGGGKSCGARSPRETPALQDPLPNDTEQVEAASCEWLDAKSALKHAWNKDQPQQLIEGDGFGAKTEARTHLVSTAMAPLPTTSSSSLRPGTTVDSGCEHRWSPTKQKQKNRMKHIKKCRNRRVFDAWNTTIC